jgi:hypothetical protein
MSTYNDLDIFGSGPHRSALAPLGEYVLSNARVDAFQAGSTPIGPLELIITIRGRLVAGTQDDLWLLHDNIAALLTDPPHIATLKDTTGRSWSDMAFITFTTADRTDRARTFSLAYSATFIRFAPP